MKLHFNSIVLIAITLLCSAILIKYKSIKRLQRLHSVLSEEAKTGYRGESVGDPAWSLSDKLFSALYQKDQSIINSIAQKVLSFNEDELIDFTSHLLDGKTEDNADALLALIGKIMDGVALESPAKALEMGSLLLPVQGVSNFERKIMRSWSQASMKEIQDHFLDASKTFDEHHASMLGSILQNEGIDHLDSYLTWLGAGSGEGDDKAQKIKKELTYALARHANDKSFEKVIALYEKYADHNDVTIGLADLAVPYLQKDFEKGVEWMLNMKANEEVRDSVIQTAISDLAVESPEQAIRILQETFPKYDSLVQTGSVAGKEESSYDQFAYSFLESAIWHKGVELELTNIIESIHDSKLRERYRNIHQNLKNEKS